MKRFVNRLLVIFVLFPVFFATSASAQEKFTIAGGGGIKQGSIYSSMVETISKYCSTDEVPIEEVNTNGGLKNLELLKGNKVKAAFIPSDLLMAAKFNNASSVANIWTLATMHVEAEHLIVRADVKKEGGISIGGLKNIGGSDVAFNNPEDLKGRAIGAVGGSVVTATIISDLLKFGWKVETFDTTTALLTALTSGQVDAVMISAGLQSEAVKSIKGNFKLLPLRGNSDTQAVYKPVKVEYPNLNGGRSVDTLSAKAILATRTWRNEEGIAAVAKMRACIAKNLTKIQDDGTVHASWQDVDGSDRGIWQWYDLPNVGAAPAPAKKK